MSCGPPHSCPALLCSQLCCFSRRRSRVSGPKASCVRRWRRGRPEQVRANCCSSISKVLSHFSSLPQNRASHPLPSTSSAFAPQNQLTSPSLFSLPPLFLHLTLGIKEIASVDRVNTRRPACSTSSWLHSSGFLEDKKKIGSWDAEETMRKGKEKRKHARIGDSGL